MISHLPARTTSMRGLPRRPAALLAATVAFVVISQAASFATRPGGPLAGPAYAVDTGIAGAELERIRGDVRFWSDRFAGSPTDVVAATELASAELELGRTTGDIAAYSAADAAVTSALAIVPDYLSAIALRGTTDIALHRFPAAVTIAQGILSDRPADPGALGILGDASLELGDLTTARSAFDQLTTIDGGAATTVRSAHLAFVEGRTDVAVALSRTAVSGAIVDGLSGTALAWYLAQLGDVLAATGDASGARDARDAAVRAAPDSWLAHGGRARSLAAAGDIDGAIAELDAGLAIVPQVDLLARRSDLLERRGRPADIAQAATDRATIDTIATLAKASGSVYDRAYVLYLADHGLQHERAVELARAEASVRHDAYGHDALAWALLAAAQPGEAKVEIDQALAVGIRDPRVLYHAGMIDAATGDTASARELLAAALALDPAFDLRQADRARQTLASLASGAPSVTSAP